MPKPDYVAWWSLSILLLLSHKPKLFCSKSTLIMHHLMYFIILRVHLLKKRKRKKNLRKQAPRNFLMCWIYSLSLSHMSMREKVNKPSAGDTLLQVPYHIVVTLSPNQRMPKEQKTHERSFLMDYLASSSNVLPLLTLDLRDIINLFKN